MERKRRREKKKNAKFFDQTFFSKESLKYIEKNIINLDKKYLVSYRKGKVKAKIWAMEKEGKNLKSVMAPLSWLESEALKKGETKVKKEKEGKSLFDQTFFTLFLFRKKEKGIGIGRRGSFNKLFLPKKAF